MYAWYGRIYTAKRLKYKYFLFKSTQASVWNPLAMFPSTHRCQVGQTPNKYQACPNYSRQMKWLRVWFSFVVHKVQWIKSLTLRCPQQQSPSSHLTPHTRTKKNHPLPKIAEPRQSETSFSHILHAHTHTPTPTSHPTTHIGLCLPNAWLDTRRRIRSVAAVQIGRLSLLFPPPHEIWSRFWFFVCWPRPRWACSPTKPTAPESLIRWVPTRTRCWCVCGWLLSDRLSMTRSLFASLCASATLRTCPFTRFYSYICVL